MPRLSKKEDIPALRRLWQVCFGDPPSYLDVYFSNAWTPERVFVLEQNRAIAAMTAWFPCALDGRPAAYFYAVCTAPAFRRRGYCRALTAFAERQLRAQGVESFFLVPGERSLFDFYRAMGYETVGTIGEFRTRTPAAADVQPIDAQEYLRRRNAALNTPHVQYALPELSYQKLLSRYSGGDLYAVGQAGCAAVERAGQDRIVCKELLGCPIDAGAGAILAALGGEECIARFPDAQGRPFCMAKGVAVPVYFGLAFD